MLDPHLTALTSRIDELESFLVKIRQEIASEVTKHLDEAIKAKTPPEDITDTTQDLVIKVGNLSAELKTLSRAVESIDERYPDDDEIALSKKHVIKFMKANGWYDTKGTVE
jgi:hypothetical protein